MVKIPSDYRPILTAKNNQAFDNNQCKLWPIKKKLTDILAPYCTQRNNKILGSGCGSVGRAIASNPRDLRFESIHWQEIVLNIYCQLYWRDENKETEAGNGPFKKTIRILPWKNFSVIVAQ